MVVVFSSKTDYFQEVAIPKIWFALLNIMLASPALVESDNSVTSNRLLILRMCSYAAHISSTKITYLLTNSAWLCTHCVPVHAFYLLLLVFQFGQLHVRMFSSYAFWLKSVANNTMMERQAVFCASQAWD